MTQGNFSSVLYLRWRDVASFPGLPRLQFLIACSVQKRSQQNLSCFSSFSVARDINVSSYVYNLWCHLCHRSRGKIHQAFCLHFCILQVIKNWSRGREGLIQGGWSGWLATPLGCAVSIIFFVWALSDLLERTILVNKVYDEMQIHYSDRVNSTYLEQESQTV